MLDLLGGRSITLSEVPPTDDDWYLNLLWIDRQKCLLLTHAGTLFSVFRAGVHCADLPVRLAKTASRSTLGFMNEMAFELRHQIAHTGGFRRCDIDVLNRGLHRTLRNRGAYVRPIELVAQRLAAPT
jgi:hypothetical protein